MDLLPIAMRALFAYVVLLAFVRAAGKRTVRHATPFDFTLALIVGDSVDDLLWGEVDASIFVVAVGVLLLIHVSINLLRLRPAQPQ